MRKAFYIYCLVAMFVGLLCKQPDNKPPFWEEIEQYKKGDVLSPQKAGGTLFVGASSIRLWDDLEEEFKEFDPVKRGFGGATLLDLRRYSKDIIFPYKPRQIVIYCGENDLPSDTVNASQLYERFQVFYGELRSEMPEVPVLYLSLKPSPARVKYIPIIKEYNSMISRFAKEEENLSFIDVYSLMLKNGRLRPELYVEDGLHLSKAGYEIWRQALLPHLLKAGD